TSTNGLGGNVFWSFSRAPDGSVWISTMDGGVSVWDGQRFTTNYARAKGRLVTSAVYAVLRDSRGTLWFGTGAGATRFDGTVWSSLTVANGLIGNAVRTINEDNSGAIWLGTENGLTRYDPPRQPAPEPRVTVELDKNYAAGEALPSILRGRRVLFKT